MINQLRLKHIWIVLLAAAFIGCEMEGGSGSPSAPDITSFTATPETITAGETSTLAWTITGNPTSLSIDNGVGEVTGDDVDVSPNSTTEYTLTATNADGTTTASATVTVEEDGFPEGCVSSSVTAYTVGTLVEGELTSSDCSWPSSSDKVDYYKFTLEEETNLRVDIRTNDFTRRFYIYENDGTQVYGSSINTYTKQTLSPGTYILAVRALSSGVGDYTMTTTTDSIGFAGCLALPEYELGTAISGELNLSDCLVPNSSDRLDHYLFSVGGETNLTIDIRTNDFTRRFYVYERDGTEVYSSSINSTTTITLAEGTYVIRVRALSEGTGDYTLTTTTDTIGFFGCLELEPITLGSTVEGALTLSDCLAANSSDRIDNYELTLDTETTINLEVTTDDFTRRFYIYERDGSGVYSSSINSSTMQTLAAGTYVIRVRALSGGTGDYTLSLSESP